VVPIDITEAVVTALYTVITGDVGLQGLMGGTVAARGQWLHLGMALEDAEFPYLVHAFEEDHPGTDEWALMDGWYTIDVWVESVTHTKLHQIRGRLMELLDQLYLEDTEYSWCRLWLAGRASPMATDNVMVKRYSIPFRARLARTQEIQAILER